MYPIATCTYIASQKSGPPKVESIAILFSQIFSVLRAVRFKLGLLFIILPKWKLLPNFIIKDSCVTATGRDKLYDLVFVIGEVLD